MGYPFHLEESLLSALKSFILFAIVLGPTNEFSVPDFIM